MTKQREIKFRFWHKLEKKMIYVNRLMDIGAFFVLSQTSKSALNPDGDFVIQEFTDLKDKNGKEIYEGDIVKTKDFGHEVIGDIMFWEGEFLIIVNRINALSFRQGGIKREIEVIGNIFENPKILTEPTIDIPSVKKKIAFITKSNKNKHFGIGCLEGSIRGGWIHLGFAGNMGSDIKHSVNPLLKELGMPTVEEIRAAYPDYKESGSPDYSWGISFKY